MAFKSIGALLLVLLSSATAHNITHILEQFPEFSVFNSLLNQTTIAKEINSRTTVTVLAVDNSAAGGISGQTPEVLEHLLSVHVILDYYDARKLHRLSRKSAVVTTLFQSSGVAGGRSGFLNVTDLNDGTVAFGSAAPGAGLTANFVKELATQPYNISVLQISGVIFPPGIDGMKVPPPPPPPPPAAKSPAPAPANKKAVAPSPVKAEAPVEAPEASSPAPEAADAPAADSPGMSPGPSPAEADAPADGAADGPADAPEVAKDEKSSSAGRVVAGASLAFAMVAAFLAAL